MILLNGLFSCKKKTNDPDYYIHILPLAGDSDLMKCHTYKIKWQSNSSDRVKIDLYKNGSISRNISPGTVNDGQYSWYVSSRAEEIGNNCFKIKITSVDNGSISGISPSPFTIVADTDTINAPKLTVIYPNGGELWTNGTERFVVVEKNFNTNVDLYIYCGATMIDYLLDLPGDTINVFCINFPVNSNYKIKARSSDYNSIYDFSDDFFEICGGKKSQPMAKPHPHLLWHN